MTIVFCSQDCASLITLCALQLFLKYTAHCTSWWIFPKSCEVFPTNHFLSVEANALKWWRFRNTPVNRQGDVVYVQYLWKCYNFILETRWKTVSPFMFSFYSAHFSRLSRPEIFTNISIPSVRELTGSLPSKLTNQCLQQISI